VKLLFGGVSLGLHTNNIVYFFRLYSYLVLNWFFMQINYYYHYYYPLLSFDWAAPKQIYVPLMMVMTMG